MVSAMACKTFHILFLFIWQPTEAVDGHRGFHACRVVLHSFACLEEASHLPRFQTADVVFAHLALAVLLCGWV